MTDRLWCCVSSPCYPPMAILSFTLYMNHNRSVDRLHLHRWTDTLLLLSSLYLSGDEWMMCSSDILAEDVSGSSGSSWALCETPAGYLGFNQQPLPLMESFTHLSKQISWVQRDVRRACLTTTGRRILLLDMSLWVCVCVVCMCVYVTGQPRWLRHGLLVSAGARHLRT